MKKIDSFFDTFEKRSCFICLIYLLCAFIFVLNHMFMAIQLIDVDSYDKMLELSTQGYLQYAFFGRSALLLLNLPFFDLAAFLTSLSVHFYEFIYFIGSLAGLFSHFRKYCLSNLFALLMNLILIIICFALGFNSGSLNEAAAFIRMIGIGMMMIYGSLLIVNIVGLIRILHSYHDALQVSVEIIE